MWTYVRSPFTLVLWRAKCIPACDLHLARPTLSVYIIREGEVEISDRYECPNPKSNLLSSAQPTIPHRPCRINSATFGEENLAPY